MRKGQRAVNRPSASRTSPAATRAPLATSARAALDEIALPAGVAREASAHLGLARKVAAADDRAEFAGFKAGLYLDEGSSRDIGLETHQWSRRHGPGEEAQQNEQRDHPTRRVCNTHHGVLPGADCSSVAPCRVVRNTQPRTWLPKRKRRHPKATALLTFVTERAFNSPWRAWLSSAAPRPCSRS